MLTPRSDGGTQGTRRLDERVLSPLRICINSVALTHLVIAVLLHDIYTLFFYKSLILHYIPTSLFIFIRHLF